MILSPSKNHIMIFQYELEKDKVIKHITKLQTLGHIFQVLFKQINFPHKYSTVITEDPNKDDSPQPDK